MFNCPVAIQTLSFGGLIDSSLYKHGSLTNGVEILVAKKVQSNAGGLSRETQ